MAIIGHGDIASALIDRQDLIFFASGVSNSQETNEENYKRENNLLIDTIHENKGVQVVYFSSIGVLDSISRYYQHKRQMERVIQQLCPIHNIVRLGNIDWGNNPHTLINYLKAHPEAEIRDEYRYITNKDEFQYWVNKIPNWTCEIMIPGRRMKVQEIKDEYC